MATSQPIAPRTREQKAHARRAFISSFLGTTLEFYDFLLYASLAALVFPTIFFGNLDPEVGVILSFVTLGAGYLARPVGGIIFGHFGDRMGRKRMLLITMVIMGAVSVCIGLLPGYATMGVAAPVILVALRVVQGVAMGGEWAGATLMAMEHAPKNRKGFGASVAVAGGPSGAVLATSILALFSLLPEDQFLAWGWRVPFLLSVLLVVVALYMRVRVSETPEFIEAQKREHAAVTQGGKAKTVPLLEVFRRYPLTVLITILGAVATVYMQSMVNSFGLTFATLNGHARADALLAFTAASVFHIFTILFWAWVSDKVGRRQVMIVGTIVSALAVWPGFMLLAGPGVWSVFLGFMLLAPIAQAIMYGPVGAFVSEMYDTKTRYTGGSLSYQIASALGGGFAPVISAALFASAGIAAVNIMFGVVCAVGVVALILSRWLKVPTEPASAPVDEASAEVAEVAPA